MKRFLLICTLLLSFFLVGCAEQVNVDSAQKDEELTNKVVPTLTTTSWEILSEKRRTYKSFHAAHQHLQRRVHLPVDRI